MSVYRVEKYLKSDIFTDSLGFFKSKIILQLSVVRNILKQLFETINVCRSIWGESTTAWGEAD